MDWSCWIERTPLCKEIRTLIKSQSMTHSIIKESLLSISEIFLNSMFEHMSSGKWHTMLMTVVVGEAKGSPNVWCLPLSSPTYLEKSAKFTFGKFANLVSSSCVGVVNKLAKNSQLDQLPGCRSTINTSPTGQTQLSFGQNFEMILCWLFADKQLASNQNHFITLNIDSHLCTRW